MLTDDFAVEIGDADRLDKNESGDFFVVDVWKKSDDSWKLATRYVAKLKALPPTSRIVPKPTGKQ